MTIGYILFNLRKFKMATSRMAISKMAFHFGIASKHHFVSVFSLDQPLYWNVTKIILDSQPGSHLESIVVVVGGIHMSVNYLLSDWYTNGWHRTTLAF